MTAIQKSTDFSLPAKWQTLFDLGFSVIPIKRPSKNPLGKWKAYQTERADFETLHRWSKQDCNIGIVTGAVSGVIVLDLDNQEAIAEAEAMGMPDTLAVSTPRGMHVYFKHPGYPLGNRAGVRPGWDIRGDGGFVVTAGSHFIPTDKERNDGKVEGEYRWQNPPGMFGLAAMPSWLEAMLSKPWADAALQGEATSLLNAPEGRRNASLNTAAMKLGQIVGGGHLAADDVVRTLQSAALEIGLAPDEIGPTIASGFAKGSSEPRHPPLTQSETRKRDNNAKRSERCDPETGEVFVLTGDISEDAIALAFTSRFKDTLRFDHTANIWFEYDGSRWRADKRQRAFSYARDIGRLLSRGDKGERGLCRAAVASGAERFARADEAHAVDASVWDLDPLLIGTPLGTIDLTTGKMRKASPQDYITKQTAVAPESGEPTLWLKFLDESLSGNADTIRFLQQWFGYCLTGLTSEHALFFIYGSGGNGKSVFINTLTKILGDYAVTAAMETFTASSNDRHTTELAMLAGARMVTASETEEGRAWAEAKVKQMTGGDPITARFMHKDFFTFVPQFKLTIAGNHAPTLRNVDDAMRRRFNIVPFTRKPANPDRQLEEKLREEHGKILAWAIAGCLDWQANGLVRPAPVTEATADYFESQDLFGQWVADVCESGPEKWEQPTPLYNSWCAYSREAGEDPGALKTFTANLQKRGFPAKKTGTKGRFYSGLALKWKPALGHFGDGSDG